MSTPADREPLKNPPKAPPVPQPSASVLLISPTNQILLLHRVRTSTSFPSAHVFPGGALSAFHDGPIPLISSPDRHQDGPAYRLAAIRETFEESGILLAKSKRTGKLVSAEELGDTEREEGRRAVHKGEVRFGELLERWGLVADTEGLRACTRWVTPRGVGRRFSTAMYVYFLPVGSSSSSTSAFSKDIGLGGTSTSTSASAPPSRILQNPNPDPDPNTNPHSPELIIPHPTPDGGIEHTAARFLPPHKWLDLARQNRIILFPPQFFLLYLLAPFLCPAITSSSSSSSSSSSLIASPEELLGERERFLEFLAGPRVCGGRAEVGFAEACISPVEVARDGDGEGLVAVERGRSVLALDWPGEEVEEQGLGRRGLREWVVLARFMREGPRDVEVRRRDEVLGVGVGRGKGGGKL
ncbi:hypothetical protein CC80DRAFT_549807 [Byssothecium circinans]|uniref:Nudix hydrolase domain-containing protein n=1 Tax=Byssothecium circinans TaxID=147558 RepID=A0A6A5TR45_9PLEO|nr:hypothetical protein CC80DRAFT_549807 [Byssothecium circinans]